MRTALHLSKLSLEKLEMVADLCFLTGETSICWWKSREVGTSLCAHSRDGVCVSVRSVWLLAPAPPAPACLPGTAVQPDRLSKVPAGSGSLPCLLPLGGFSPFEQGPESSLSLVP